jgi:hypothetical protein
MELCTVPVTPCCVVVILPANFEAGLPGLDRTKALGVVVFSASFAS